MLKEFKVVAIGTGKWLRSVRGLIFHWKPDVDRTIWLFKPHASVIWKNYQNWIWKLKTLRQRNETEKQLKNRWLTSLHRKTSQIILYFFKSTIGLSRKCPVVRSEHQVTGQVSFTANQFPRERRYESSSCRWAQESWKHLVKLGDRNIGVEQSPPCNVSWDRHPSLNSGVSGSSWR